MITIHTIRRSPRGIMVAQTIFQCVSFFSHDAPGRTAPLHTSSVAILSITFSIHQFGHVFCQVAFHYCKLQIAFYGDIGLVECFLAFRSGNASKLYWIEV